VGGVEMLDQIDSLESLIGKVSVAMSELKAEKDRMGEELETLRGMLNGKEKEMERLSEEREVTEKRLAALLEKLRATWEPATEKDQPAERDTPEQEEEHGSLESEEVPPEAPAGELFKFDKDPHQGDLADRF